MDMSELAFKMLEWEKTKRELDLLTKEISEVVLEIGQTQTVGNVRATYSQPRKSYDYTMAIHRALQVEKIGNDSLLQFQTVSVDYRAACKEFEITDIPVTESDPSVAVKLLPVKTHEPIPEQHTREKAESVTEKDKEGNVIISD